MGILFRDFSICHSLSLVSELDRAQCLVQVAWSVFSIAQGIKAGLHPSSVYDAYAAQITSSLSLPASPFFFFAQSLLPLTYPRQ